MLMKITAPKANPKSKIVAFQRLTRRAKHGFQWSRGSVASCSCKGWTLWHFSLPWAKANHRHHIAGLPHEDLKKDLVRVGGVRMKREPQWGRIHTESQGPSANYAGDEEHFQLSSGKLVPVPGVPSVLAE
jgi:hypothetical protein